MTDTSSGPTPYRVVYSEWVRQELTKLIAKARDVGRYQEVLGAVKAIDERLRLYPQFGQPLRDLQLEPAQLWLGVIPPLTVQYALDEEKRLVMVVAPIVPLPGSGL